MDVDVIFSGVADEILGQLLVDGEASLAASVRRGRELDDRGTRFAGGRLVDMRERCRLSPLVSQSVAKPLLARIDPECCGSGAVLIAGDRHFDLAYHIQAISLARILAR